MIDVLILAKCCKVHKKFLMGEINKTIIDKNNQQDSLLTI